MRSVLALALCLLAAAPAVAGDRAAIVEALGGLSVAPQICGIDIDREALRAVGSRLLPEERELSVATFRVNDRISREHPGWSEADRTDYCDASKALAAELGVLR